MTEEFEMPTKYDSHRVEDGRYQWWLEHKTFEPSGDSEAEPYTIVIPPPNVTGKLHLGHAWDNTLQDMIIRQKRMQGYDTLYLPGMDHAGIATQAKVEDKLAQAGISRYDLGREKFIDEVWQWKEEYAGRIRQQWEKLGLSLDYSRERFTLDEGLSKAVREVFVTLYEKGIIYRGEYIINWDPKARTALSDIEVEHKEIEGAFYHILYPLSDGSDHLEIATTRPETMLGDTAIAVHPDDERYQKYIGKSVILPLVNREIPVIADSYVEREFGSGVVKITPAHDPNDFEVGLRHDLPRINVMNEDATMNEQAGAYAGLDRFEARKRIVADLEEQGLLIKTEQMVHSVGHSERTGVIVEPRLSTQWFVKMKDLAENILAFQQTDRKVHFYPERFEKTFSNWMENVHDWVISRQLWWGHQIPAWYHKETGAVYVGRTEPEDIENWTQDEDVLDTWFSSALWPFSTLNWPDLDDADFQRYYPTNTLVTGYDIIFFWVARMMFQGLAFTGQRPFDNVLIHGLIRAEDGQKMSKSLGNGIDPMDVVEEYGADALRWFLSTGSTPGQDIRFSYEKMGAAWNFMNKIWNASRYVLMNTQEMTRDQLDMSGQKSLADRWILARLNETIQHVTEQFDKFEFGEAGRALYHFIWDDYCDWYIEMTKEVLEKGTSEQKRTTKSVLVYVLEQALKLMHPITPFITEEIYSHFAHYQSGDSIMTASYPEARDEFADESAVQSMNILIELITFIRQTRQEVNRPISQKIDLFVKAENEQIAVMLKENQSLIERFCGTNELVIDTSLSMKSEAKSGVITGAELFLPLEGLIHVEEELDRLGKELEKWQSEIERVDKKLANKQFVANAPEHIVEAEREKGREYHKRYQATKAQIDQLQEL